MNICKIYTQCALVTAVLDSTQRYILVIQIHRSIRFNTECQQKKLSWRNSETNNLSN